MNEVAALVGYNKKGTISKSYSSGTITGKGNDVGGLVGRQEFNGKTGVVT